MEALQVLKFSIHKGSSSLNFTEGMSWEDELKEFELMARTIPSEDPDTYSRNLNVAENNEEELEVIVEEAITKALQDLGDEEDGMKDQILSTAVYSSFHKQCYEICIC